MSVRHSKFYLDKRNAKLLGVCSGISDYIGIDALWIRVATVVLVIMGAGWPILLYLAIAFIADAKPRELYDLDPEETRFWQDFRTRPRATVRDVHGRFRDIDRRLADIETHYTSSQSRLAREIEALRDTQ